MPPSPPRMPLDPEGYYARLGVEPSCVADTIAAAYRRGARLVHPDVPGTGDAGAFVELKQAYEVLIHPVRRAAYDHLARKESAPRPRYTQRHDEEPGEIGPTPFPDIASLPTRHPRWHDLPASVWVGMAAVLAVGLIEVGLHLNASPGQARRETIPAAKGGLPVVTPATPPTLTENASAIPTTPPKEASEPTPAQGPIAAGSGRPAPIARLSSSPGVPADAPSHSAVAVPPASVQAAAKVDRPIVAASGPPVPIARHSGSASETSITPSQPAPTPPPGPVQVASSVAEGPIVAATGSPIPVAQPSALASEASTASSQPAAAISPPVQVAIAQAPAASVPSPSAVTTTLSAAAIKSLLRRASEKLVDGDVLSARLFFERAAAAGSEAGIMGAGKTYDPDFLRSVDAAGSRGDIARAIEWYRKAASLFGNRDAEKRLSSLAVANALKGSPDDLFETAR